VKAWKTMAIVSLPLFGAQLSLGYYRDFLMLAAGLCLWRGFLGWSEAVHRALYRLYMGRDPEES